jgi:hypothetical protein
MKKPQKTKNYQGNERKVGFEIEYTGLALQKAAEIIRNLFGGKINKESDAVFKVNDTELGDFTMEVDAIPLQKIAKSSSEIGTNAEESLVDNIGLHLGKVIGSTGAKIVPLEIVTPPIKISALSQLEILKKELYNAGAKDTKENFYTAFGLHINPEVASLDVNYILNHLQSFLLLAPWLEQMHEIDLTRRATGFADPFPKPYLELVLNKHYAPDMEQLIKDYHEHNPTRNRALDMLPLFAYINEPLIKELYGEKKKINKRPTFHYRLPNCEIADENWSLNTEWERWLYIEDLANNPYMLHQLIEKWVTHQEHWFSFESDWVKEITKAIEKQ